MSRRLVECVPNFSEGKDEAVIAEITAAIVAVEGVTLLDVDMGADFHRTVVTMVGEPEPILEAALAATEVALELIDMTTHRGEHARMGAVDVVPFIPISGVSMSECVELAERFGRSASERFGLPIYLYAEAAKSEQRVKLPEIRRGEYEGFEEKILEPEWAPDFGPAEFKPKIGVTATGARSLLIAYNVNLNTDDKSAANRIAGKLRTSGVLKKDGDGEKVIGPDGKPERIPGRFQSLQGAGWMYDELTAQVSMNLLDHEQTGLHTVTEAIRQEAAYLGLETTAGELVGLVPLAAITAAGRFYHESPESADEGSLVEAAIAGLQLDALAPFVATERIIEFAAEGV
jgi:glutamate formiminotransferase/formiminotetrahydrofolate cyclodeaminase